MPASRTGSRGRWQPTPFVTASPTRSDRGIDAIGFVIGNALGYGLLELRYLGLNVTDRLPADVPDSLVQLAIDLHSECDRDRCFTITVDALLNGLTPRPAG